MMRGLVATLEKHHKVRILDEAVSDAVRLSHRYITGRQLPDKSVSLLDTACARVAIGQSATPPADRGSCSREVDRAGHRRSTFSSAKASPRAPPSASETRRADADESAKPRTSWRRWKPALEGRNANWSARSAKSADKLEAARLPSRPQRTPARRRKQGRRRRRRPRGRRAPTPQIAKLWREELTESSNAQPQGSCRARHPLMQVCVDSQAIAEVVSSWTGIPVGRMVTDEIQTVLTLKERMEERIIGQSHALEAHRPARSAPRGPT